MYAALSRVNMYTPRRVNLYATRSRVNLYAAPRGVNLYATRSRVNLYAALWGVNLYATHSRVNLYAAPLEVNLYAALSWVNVYAAHSQVNLYVACSQLNLYAAHLQLNLYATYPQGDVHVTHQWVNNKMILPVCVQMYNLPQFEGSYASVWRDSTAQYNVVDHPFFVFHPKPVDCSNFGETFKMYARQLRQYRIIHIIEFVFLWSNHWCCFMSKHSCMLVNFDLTPQQHCQRARLTICQSQYYKHDFAVISSVSDLCINYTVVGFVKYLEIIIQWTITHKHIYKISVWYSAKTKNKINNCFEFSEQKVSSKIGGGKHIEKIGMDVIRPFIINTPPNISDIKMCEFVDHLAMSECLEKYQSPDYLLCNIPLHHFIHYLFQPNRISIGNSHGVCIWKNMTKFDITNVFKNHNGACKHEYLTVFRPYKQISSSERKSNYRKNLQKSPVNNISDRKLSENLEGIEPEHNVFPPDIPNASLRKKIINDFCEATC